MNVVVVSADYPSGDYSYGDVFVHTRLREYAKTLDVRVIGYNADLKADRQYEYDHISVFISNDFLRFETELRKANPDVIVVHFIQHVHTRLLAQMNKALLIFIHGYEALSWKRRLMNYTTLGDFRYLLPYVIANRKQLRILRNFAANANRSSTTHFVFVSRWLKNAVESDWNLLLRNSHIIPNGIDTVRFSHKPKAPEKRKKILVIRSFQSRNYANDLSIEAILLLSKKDFFQELEFSVYGEGFLFKKLTSKVEHLPNVRLFNSFIQNEKIPAIHANHGIFLCPSRLDSQGVSMCEAMSSGLVPIASPIGGIPEYSENNVSAFHVSTPAEIAETIERLYRDPELFLKMSEEARKAIEQKCAIKETIPAEIDLIRSVGKTGSEQVGPYLQCRRCVLDTNDDPQLTVDTKGVCSYCQTYDENESQYVKAGEQGTRELLVIVNKIKETGKGKPYDCVIGLSGGVDSTYLALKAHELGLRPLAVHFDNGWNSELAVSNIENIVNRLGFDLHTVVIDWEEFRDLQLAFLKASVVDIEVVTDHAIFASLYKIALERKIKYILSGVNFVTESILPEAWIHDKRDHIHIRAISRQFGKIPLRKYPLFTTELKIRSAWHGTTSVSMLNYLPYVKSETKKIITEKLGWRDYGGKHYESIFTRFYQGYILPTKFGIDKRKAHLSNLINSKQITREEALQELRTPTYPDELRKSDYQFVLKKLGLSDEEFQEIMHLPMKQHSDYPVDEDIYTRFPLLSLLAPVWKLLKRIKSV